MAKKSTVWLAACLLLANACGENATESENPAAAPTTPRSGDSHPAPDAGNIWTGTVRPDTGTGTDSRTGRTTVSGDSGTGTVQPDNAGTGTVRSDTGDTGTDTGTGTDSRTGRTAVSGTAVSGTGTVRIATRRLPQAAADPAAHIGQPAIYVWPAFYDGLTFITESGNVVPWLATSWENTSDTTWVFRLRDEVAFSNGEPFDAWAVQAAADNILFGYGAHKLVRSSLLPDVVAVNVVDELTVEFVTGRPDPLLPKRVAQFYPLPPEYFAAVGPEAFAQRPVGTGPFVVESWDVNEVLMRANPNSWRPPMVQALDFVEMPDSTTRRQAILSGQVHIAQHLVPDDIPELEAAGIEITVAAEPRVRVISFVARDGSPLQSSKVRLALNHAVNKDAIVNALVGGVAPVATHIATRSTAGFDPSRKPHAYDPPLARRLLQEAGHAEGLDFLMEVVATTHIDRLVFQAIAADLADVGVNVRLRVIEFEQWRRQLFTGQWKGELFSWSVALDPVLDITRAFPYLSCEHPKPAFCDRQLTDLLGQLALEFDPDTREAILDQVFDRMHANPPAILIYELVQIDGLRGINGFANPNLFVVWDQLSLN